VAQTINRQLIESEPEFEYSVLCFCNSKQDFELCPDIHSTMADDYDNEAFEPDHAAENSVLRSQLQSLQAQLQTAQTAAESAEAALRAVRVAGRRQKTVEDAESRRTDACDDDAASAALIETPFTSIELQGEQMANGGFGAVHKAQWHGATVAVKKLFDPLITDELRAEFRTEVKILSRLRHPNIVQFLACCSKPPNLCIVMEWMARGSLYHVLYNSAVEFGRERQLSLMKQIAAGLEYLHSLEIVHNDIKAANILVLMQSQHFEFFIFLILSC
jgi:hypothetical protein